MNKRLLPIGIQDFADIRERGFCYVDKTAQAHRLLTGSGKAFFLSRPRRFGKSLLCSTLGAIFEGKRGLFSEIAGRPALAIDSLEWEWKAHPVIRLDLSAGNYSMGVEELHSVLRFELQRAARMCGVTLDGSDNVKNQFKHLIDAASENAGARAAVIIDEYDTPLIGTIGEPPVHVKLREELKAFYGVLKSSDAYLRFVFLTGVSKFSHVSIFSDLNQLSDMTLDPRYADICGLTQEEVEANFEPELAAIRTSTGKSREGYMSELRRFYNGYRFSEDPTSVYNPFGLLKHFDNEGRFLPYWYETSTPTFLVTLIAKQKINIANLNNMQVGYGDFRKYDIDDLRAEPLLYQAGYLTISSYDVGDKLYTLDFPNDEVRIAFATSLVDQYVKSSGETAGGLNTKLVSALSKGDVDGVVAALRAFLASIPYDIIKETENYYETAIHLIFTMLGVSCRSEVRIAAGRIDTLVETANFVYCFEFKLKGTAEEALAQIDTKEYLLPWAGSGKKLFKIGVAFDLEKRNIGDWRSESVKPKNEGVKTGTAAALGFCGGGATAG